MLDNPQATLQYAFRKFTCLTEGDAIRILHHQDAYDLTVEVERVRVKFLVFYSFILFILFFLLYVASVICIPCLIIIIIIIIIIIKITT